MKKFNERELSQHNNKNGAPAYVDCNGKVNDVSDSFQWKGGKHQVLHSVGEDLTDNLVQAPHGIDLFERFSVVGILRTDISD